MGLYNLAFHTVHVLFYVYYYVFYIHIHISTYYRYTVHMHPTHAHNYQHACRQRSDRNRYASGFGYFGFLKCWLFDVYTIIHTNGFEKPQVLDAVSNHLSLFFLTPPLDQILGVYFLFFSAYRCWVRRIQVYHYLSPAYTFRMNIICGFYVFVGSFVFKSLVSRVFVFFLYIL